MGYMRSVYKISLGKPEGKETFGRTIRKWEDNIKMDPKKIGCEDVDWIRVAQDRDRWQEFVKTVMSLRVPREAWNFLTSWATTTFSRKTLLHAVSAFWL
jgi:hypothetical protein